MNLQGFPIQEVQGVQLFYAVVVGCRGVVHGEDGFGKVILDGQQGAKFPMQRCLLPHC